MQSASADARLLMRQKLKKFAGLVDMAEKQGGPAKISAEDLQVKKDMISSHYSSSRIINTYNLKAKSCDATFFQGFWDVAFGYLTHNFFLTWISWKQTAGQPSHLLQHSP